MNTGQPSHDDGLRRAARLAASIAGATGSEVGEIAEEALARLLMQDGLVNNPKAWVRTTATRLTRQTQARQRIRIDDVLEELDLIERRLVMAHRAGFSPRELAEDLGLSEETTRTLLSEANRKVRRSTRRFADVDR